MTSKSSNTLKSGILTGVLTTGAATVGLASNLLASVAGAKPSTASTLWVVSVLGVTILLLEPEGLPPALARLPPCLAGNDLNLSLLLPVDCLGASVASLSSVLGLC